MSSLFYTILTDAGASLIAKSQASGTALRILEGSVGTSAHNPVATDTSILGESYRAPLKSLKKTESSPTLEIEFEVPADQGGWPIHNIGIYGTASDNENAAADTLIAIAKLTGAYKPLPQEGAGSISSYRIFLAVSSTANINLVLPPGNTAATQAWVQQIIAEAVKATKEALYPVGSYYETDLSDNPSKILGFGFWERIEGLFLVGRKVGDADFASAGKTGGEKTFKLSINNIPAHAHELQNLSCAQAGRDNGGIGSSTLGSHGGGAGPALAPTRPAGKESPDAVKHLPPYWVTNIWRRTA